MVRRDTGEHLFLQSAVLASWLDRGFFTLAGSYCPTLDLDVWLASACIGQPEGFCLCSCSLDLSGKTGRWPQEEEEDDGNRDQC